MGNKLTPAICKQLLEKPISTKDELRFHLYCSKIVAVSTCAKQALGGLHLLNTAEKRKAHWLVVFGFVEYAKGGQFKPTQSELDAYPVLNDIKVSFDDKNAYDSTIKSIINKSVLNFIEAVERRMNYE